MPDQPNILVTPDPVDARRRLVRPPTRFLWIMFAFALVATALLAAGCGGSDKPAYCSDESDLEQSVDDVKGDIESGDFSALTTDISTLRSDANAVVSSAKQDFPSETSALESSVSSLATAVDQLPESPTAEQLKPLVQPISSVVTAKDGLKSATSSACD